MSAGQTGACWNCRQPLQAGAATCLWCGVSQQAPATQFVMAPSGATAPGTVAAGQMQAPNQVSMPSPGQPQALATPAVYTPRRPAQSALALPAVFRGTVASTPTRLAAFSIDFAAVAAVTAVAAIASSSALLAGLTALESMVFLWVLEARTGLTVGNTMLRIRTSRADTPYSPGIGRALLKDLMVGAGLLGAVVGAWVVVGSSAWDGARRGRGWADIASRTISVAVPRRARAAATAASAGSPQLVQPARPAGQRIEPQVTGLGASRVVPSLARTALAIEDSVAMSQTGVNPGGGAFAIEQTAPPVVPVAVLAPMAPVPPIAGIPPAPGVVVAPPVEPVAVAVVAPPVEPVAVAAVAPPVVEAASPLGLPVQAPAVQSPSAGPGTLLLIFDTGQREQLELPTAVNIGRKPTATDPTDQLISVNDPEGTVSKTHVRLEHSRGRTWVTDNGSTNGTELLEDDGGVVVLQVGQRTSVDDGVRVRIGNRAFTISVLLDGGNARTATS